MRITKLLLGLCFLLFLVGCDSLLIDQGPQIYFETNGGESLPKESADMKSNLPEPVKEGHTFIGWFEDELLTIEFDEKKEITKDMTLYAGWVIKTYTVTFLDDDGNLIERVSVQYKEAAVAPVAPQIEGKLFVEWSLPVNSVVRDLIVQPIYVDATYTLTFSRDGETVYHTIENVGYHEKVTLPVLSKPGYFFAGWKYKGMVLETEIKVTENMFLIAHFEEIPTYTLVIEDGVSAKQLQLNYGDTVTLDTPVKPGFEFLGWYIDGEYVGNTFTYNYTDNKNVKAKWGATLETLKIGGSNVMYRNSSAQVMIPTSYIGKEKEFRSVWVTAYTGDIAKYQNKTQYQNELISVLNMLQSYNMNAIIFHVRMQNDAMYRSDLNPQSSYIPGLDLTEWDYLEWFIEECHKRNIEFHAWMNPYRLRATGYGSNATPASVAANWPSYNPASNPENVLVTTRDDGNRGAILNPGREEVRDFVIRTCMELIERYNVDAIHFDDYFYANLGTNGGSKGSILDEADQVTYSDYIDKYPNSGYRKNNATDKANWRREQINLFIKGLSDEIRAFNISHGRAVQLGISPTGIYRNGNGVVTYDANGTAISTGSNTKGQEHYASYLYCDSKLWVDNEWIDYIVPQTYWAFTHPLAGYADVVDWWAKVVKYKNVQLYTGMGLYMADSNNYSWKTNAMEAAQQVLYNTKHPEIKGTVVFSYQYLKKTTLSGMMTIKNEYWSTPVRIK